MAPFRPEQVGLGGVSVAYGPKPLKQRGARQGSPNGNWTHTAVSRGILWQKPHVGALLGRERLRGEGRVGGITPTKWSLMFVTDHQRRSIGTPQKGRNVLGASAVKRQQFQPSDHPLPGGEKPRPTRGRGRVRNPRLGPERRRQEETNQNKHERVRFDWGSSFL